MQTQSMHPGACAQLVIADSPSNLAPTLTVIDGQVTTTSMQVAEHFGKQHKNVLRAIANLECSAEFARLNFEPVITEYKNGKGGVQTGPAYRITRDGFVFLAMGFTGKEAARWKEAYITAFNQMEALLNNPRKTIPYTDLTLRLAKMVGSLSNLWHTCAVSKEMVLQNTLLPHGQTAPSARFCHARIPSGFGQDGATRKGARTAVASVLNILPAFKSGF